MKLAFKFFAFQFEMALLTTTGRITKYTEIQDSTPPAVQGFYLQNTLQKCEDRFT